MSSPPSVTPTVAPNDRDIAALETPLYPPSVSGSRVRFESVLGSETEEPFRCNLLGRVLFR